MILVVGVTALLTILSLELIYFRRAIFILMIPASVIFLTVIAILRHKHSLIWPIIAISVSCSTKNTGFCKYFIAYFELFYNILPLYILSCILGIRKSTDFIKMRRYYTILDLSYGERETVYSG